MNPLNTPEAYSPGETPVIPEYVRDFLGITGGKVSDLLSIKDTISQREFITKKDINDPLIWDYLILEGNRNQWECIANMGHEKTGKAGVLLDALKLFFLGKGDKLDILTEDDIPLRDTLRPVFDFVISRFR